MEAAKSLTIPTTRRYFSRILILSLFLIVATITITVTVVMRRKAVSSDHPDTAVLLPLYVYPAVGAWDPLYTV
jgi:hypothetical protein